MLEYLHLKSPLLSPPLFAMNKKPLTEDIFNEQPLSGSLFCIFSLFFIKLKLMMLLKTLKVIKMTVQAFLVILHVALLVLFECYLCSCFCVEACNTVTSPVDGEGSCAQVSNAGISILGVKCKKHHFYYLDTCFNF